MISKEHEQLASYTTLGVGGRALFLHEAFSREDAVEALQRAHVDRTPLAVLGGGSNVLIPDEGIKGVVLRMRIGGIRVYEEQSGVILEVGAGVEWDDVVTFAAQEGWWGIENLAAIPGTVGGAAVQNIGAYGTELSQAYEAAKVLYRDSKKEGEITATEANFSYRMSCFKKDPNMLVTCVRLKLSRDGRGNFSYPDLAKLKETGASLDTPEEIADAVRLIRSQKFPHRGEGGTAGSFFKHPIVEKHVADELVRRYPGLPHFFHDTGRVKLSLTWMLDHILGLKGHAVRGVRLYEKQPLVVVTQPGVTANDIDMFANEIAERVRAATGIVIEREVETLRAHA